MAGGTSVGDLRVRFNHTHGLKTKKKRGKHTTATRGRTATRGLRKPRVAEVPRVAKLGHAWRLGLGLGLGIHRVRVRVRVRVRGMSTAHVPSRSVAVAFGNRWDLNSQQIPTLLFMCRRSASVCRTNLVLGSGFGVLGYGFELGLGLGMSTAHVPSRSGLGGSLGS